MTVKLTLLLLYLLLLLLPEGGKRTVFPSHQRHDFKHPPFRRTEEEGSQKKKNKILYMCVYIWAIPAKALGS